MHSIQQLRPSLIALGACLLLIPIVRAQQPELAAAPPVLPRLPDSPSPADPAPANLERPGTALAASTPVGSLTLRQRFAYEAKASFSPIALLAPALSASITMARPPDHYPREWKDGAGAFGRNYGADLGANSAGGFTRFATQALLREDPRYYPSSQTRTHRRVLHALAFTLFDRSNSGHTTLAIGNFAGGAAAGFVGMAWQPAGYNDTTHAVQQGSIELATYAGHNLLREFHPEISRTFQILHLPHSRD